MGRDEPSVGPGAIDFAPKPEEHAIHDNDGEEEQLIFEDFVIQLQRGWTDGRTDDSRAGRKTKIFQVYSKPSYSPSRGGGATNSSCVKFANELKSNDAILLRTIASDSSADLGDHTAYAELLSHAHEATESRPSTTANPTNFTAHTLTMSFLARNPALRRQIVQSRAFVQSRGVHGYKVYIQPFNLHRMSLCSPFNVIHSSCHSTMKVQRQFSAPRLPFSFSLGSLSQGSPLTIRCMSIFWPFLSVSVLQPLSYSRKAAGGT